MKSSGDMRSMHRTTFTAATMVFLLLAGCSAAGQQRTGDVALAHGTAEVIFVNPYLKTAVVRYRGRRRNAWWNRYSILFFDGHVTARLLVKPGQRVEFDGLLADGDVYFGRVWRGTPPPPVVYPPSRTVYPNGVKPKKNMKINKTPHKPAVPGMPGLGQYLREQHLGS